MVTAGYSLEVDKKDSSLTRYAVDGETVIVCYADVGEEGKTYHIVLYKNNETKGGIVCESVSGKPLRVKITHFCTAP